MPGAAPTVDRYLAGQPPAARAALRTIRAAVRRAVPDAEETISYGIPAFRLGGRILLHLAGWQEHCSVYPATPGVVALGAAVRPHLAGKGTLRFPLGRRVPVGLIGRIARVRAREVAERAAAREARRPARGAASPRSGVRRRARRSARPSSAPTSPRLSSFPSPGVRSRP